ncbi:hypothetical protein Ccrd_010467, partial [Cynara cardunculus var. scolymus]
MDGGCKDMTSTSTSSHDILLVFMGTKDWNLQASSTQKQAGVPPVALIIFLLGSLLAQRFRSLPDQSLSLPMECSSLLPERESQSFQQLLVLFRHPSFRPLQSLSSPYVYRPSSPQDSWFRNREPSLQSLGFLILLLQPSSLVQFPFLQ